jgi:hypothetical protein
VVEQYLIWVLLAGVALGAAGTWFVIGRLPRHSEDVSPPEMAAEAEWISQTIKSRGGVAPVALVQEVLELHVDYLGGEPLDVLPPEATDADLDADLQADAAARGPATPAAPAAPAAPATSPADERPAEAGRRPAGEPPGR